MAQLSGEMTPGVPEVPLRGKGRSWGGQGETRPAPGRGASSGRPGCWTVREHLRPRPWHRRRERLHRAPGLLVPGHQLRQPRQRCPRPRKAVTSPKPEARGTLYEDRTRERDTVLACFRGSMKQVPTLSHTGCHLTSSKFSRV